LGARALLGLGWGKRQPIRVVLDPDERPVAKGTLCASTHAFNLQAATVQDKLANLSADLNHLKFSSVHFDQYGPLQYDS
jgi:hypothetical protein